MKSPPGEDAIIAECFPPLGPFVDFPMGDVEITEQLRKRLAAGQRIEPIKQPQRAAVN